VEQIEIAEVPRQQFRVGQAGAVVGAVKRAIDNAASTLARMASREKSLELA
jgi:hypothetical protein